MKSLESVWARDLPATGALPLRIAALAAWPAAPLIVAHRIIVLAWTGSATDDFTTVWSAARRFVERVPVYAEAYHHVDPHYLYNPGATLVLSPLGLASNVDLARILFILVNAAAIVAALAWLTARCGFRPSHFVLPLSIALAFLTESVTNTLVFSNINGVLLLALVAFLDLFLRRRSVAAGVVLGLAILIKPMFAPLVLLPLMKLDWKAAAPAVGVPVALNLLAWPLTPGAGAYLTVVAPYLGLTRDYANSSLAGIAVYFGMPTWLHAALFVVLAVAVAVAVIGLARFRYSDEWLWAATTSGALIVGVCLLSSLGQAYYSMLLFPTVFTVFSRVSPMHTATAWAGCILALSPLEWKSPNMPNLGANLDLTLPTVGWAVFVIGVAAWVVSVPLPRRLKENAHDSGKLLQLERPAMARKA